MNLKQLTYFLLFSLVLACSPKDVQETEVPKPSWVDQRPIDNSYYIGIGSASKQLDPVNFAQSAKKNALDDLSSEISVTVKSSSFLNTMESNNYFREEFTSNIATYTEEKLEGFEIVGAWEDKSEYWIFYRLSKAQHSAIKEEKKRLAMNSAADFYTKGRAAEAEGNLSVAFDLMFRGLFELTAYWNEVNEFTYEGQKVFLDNEIFSHIRQMINNIDLKITPASLEVNPDNSFKTEALVSVTLDGKPVPNALHNYKFDDGRFKKYKEFRTDPSGYASLPIRDVNPKNFKNELEVVLELEDLVPNDLDPLLINPLVATLQSPVSRAPISLRLPVIYITSTELNLDNEDQLWLASAVSKKLSAEGYTFTNRIDQADYVVYISAETREGGTSQGFHVAYLNMSILVKNTKDDIIYQSAINDIKGLQLNYRSAGIEAFKKGAKQIEKDICKNIVDAIF